MAQSLSSVHIHVVFSTKDRLPLLADQQLRDNTYAFIGETLNRLHRKPVTIGGVEDHVHVLCSMNRSITISDCVKEIKRASSKWLKSSIPDFAWQRGYGAFSVGNSTLEAVQSYILQQEEHHKNASFQDEYRKFLIRHKVTFDERYLWD